MVPTRRTGGHLRRSVAAVISLLALLSAPTAAVAAASSVRAVPAALAGTSARTARGSAPAGKVPATPRPGGNGRASANRAPASGPMSRAAFATMLARLGHPSPGTVGPRFVDVPRSSPSYQAIEAVTGLNWMTGLTARRFAPTRPVDRLTAAVAAANYLGLRYVAADAAGRPLPFSDAASIPGTARGAVAVAGDLRLLPFARGAFRPGAPLTRGQADVFFSRLKGVTRAEVRAEGDRVAASVRLVPGAWVAAPGTRVSILAYAHDATGYIVPASFTWSAQGARVVSQGAGRRSGTAVLQMGGPGTVTVRASVVGSTATDGVTLSVQRAASLQAGALPPAVLSTASLRVSVSVRTGSGQIDAAADMRVVATLRRVSGKGLQQTARATVFGGQAELRLPRLSPGRYAVRVDALGTGLAPIHASLWSVPAPIGRIVLRAGGGPARVASGQPLTVDGSVYGLAGPFARAHWPLAISVTGTQDALPLLTGESAPPAILALHVASADLPSTGGPVAVVQGAAPGRGTVAVSVPGGALVAAALPVSVAALGRFGAATSTAVVVGHAAQLGVHIQGPAAAQAGPVYLEPIDPAGHPLSYILATVHGPVATARFTPLAAGTWTFRWRAAGFVPVPGGTLLARPGPPVQLVVDPTPTSVLLPGQHIALQAWLADRYGNPVPIPFTLRGGPASATSGGSASMAAPAASGGSAPTAAPVASGGSASAAASVAAGGAAAGPPSGVTGPPASPVPGAAGWLAFTPGQFGGPGVVGSFTARGAPLPGQTVTETLVFRSPTDPRAGIARVTLRVVATPADRIAGKGLWLIFSDWRDTPDAEILRWARADAVTHIYLEVATTLDGFYGGRALDNFLVQAHAAGIAVISWVYAGLEDPASDTALVRQVAGYITPSGDRADGLALDLEEVLTPATVARYAAAARAAVGPHGLVVAVTYPPQYRMQYPFHALAPYVQAFAPMDYWHVYERYYTYASVYSWVRDSVALVRRLSGRPGVPVEVIAQTFDEFAPSGTGIFSPLPHELSAADRAAADTGAIGISYYRPTTATPGEEAVMASQAWRPR